MPNWEVNWQRQISAPAAIDAARQAIALIRTGTNLLFKIKMDKKGAHLVDVIVSEGPRDPSGEELLADILQAATAHGTESEPDHEIGDLAAALTTAWQVLTPDQRRVAYQKIVEHGALTPWLEKSGVDE